MLISTSAGSKRAASIYVSILLLACACGAADRAPEDPPQPLVGTWVRIHLWTDLRDTLRLLSDGTAMGSISDAVGTVLPNGAVRRWQIGHRSMPGGLCLSSDEVIQCQGFLLKGDTLALAIAPPVVLVRVEPAGAVATPQRPSADWVPFAVRAPQLGQEVHGMTPETDRLRAHSS
jgi:hypothetical protein